MHTTIFGIATTVVPIELLIVLPQLVVVVVKIGQKPAEVVPLYHADLSLPTGTLHKSHHLFGFLYL